MSLTYFIAPLVLSVMVAATLGPTAAAVDSAVRGLEQVAAVNVDTHTRLASVMFQMDTGSKAAGEPQLAAAGYLDLPTRDEAFEAANKALADASVASDAVIVGGGL